MDEKRNLMQGIDERSAWRDVTPGGFVYGSGNSEYFNTGDWRTRVPIWKPDNCRQCLLCFPVCPDSSIPVKDGKRENFDFGHCKGCAICAKVCPFGAIDIVAGTDSQGASGQSADRQSTDSPSASDQNNQSPDEHTDERTGKGGAK